MKNLPREQVDFLEKAFKKAKRPRELLRFHALLLLAEGYKRRDVAKMVRVSTHALEDWVTGFNRAGVEGLRDKPQPGNHRKLTNDQKEKLKTLITTKTPEELGLLGRFWSPNLVSQLVKNEYNILYQHEAARKLLHSCGFSFHKPAKINKRQSPHERLRFEDTLKKGSSGTREIIRWYW